MAIQARCTVFTAYSSVWRNAFDWTGRAKRPEFWWWALIQTVIISGLLMLIGVLAVDAPFSTTEQVTAMGAGVVALYVILFVYGIASLIPSVAVAVRRLRDAGRSPAWLAIILVPFVGIIVLAIMWLLPSVTATSSEHAMRAAPAV